VTLDKQPIPVTSARSAKDDQILFAVVIDVSTSSARHSAWIREAANLLFEGLSTGGNRGYLVFFDVSAQVSAKTLQPSEARKALDGLKFGGGTALFDTIAETCKAVLSKQKNPDTPRRVILLLSDGDDNQSHTYLQEAVQLAEKEGVSVFSLATPNSGNKGEQILGEFAKDTGGQAIVNETTKDGVKAMLAAIDSQWVLSLVPPPSSKQSLHSFAVKSSQKGVQISAPAQIVLQ
jgi:Ca-activated chloride channel family protein